MSLEGAKLVCLGEDGIRGEEIFAKGRKLTVGYYMSCDLVLTNDNRAKGVHCEIQCDAFGRITIHNMSKEYPIMLNDFPVNIKRPLLNGARIKILDKEFLWEFSKTTNNEYEDLPCRELLTPEKQIGRAEQPPNSCPNLKTHKLTLNRFTVHNFAYCIQSNDAANSSIDTIVDKVQILTKKKTFDHTENMLECKCNNAPECDPLLDVSEISNTCLLNSAKSKKNTNTEKCQKSNIVLTSYSHSLHGDYIDQSFMKLIEPNKLLNESQDVYSTAKNVADNRITDFSTPSTSKKPPTLSMHLIDLTTPNRLQSALNDEIVLIKNVPFSLSSTESVINVDSSDDSPIIVDISSSSADLINSPNTFLKTPAKPLKSAATTIRPTSQSLIKRALLTSGKKQVVRQDKTQVSTPVIQKDKFLQRSSRFKERQSMTMPARKLVLGDEDRSASAGFTKSALLTSRVTQRFPTSTPIRTKIIPTSTPIRTKITPSQKELHTSNCIISPPMALSNRLKAKSRRSLCSPRNPLSSTSARARALTYAATHTPLNILKRRKSTTVKLASEDHDHSQTFIIENTVKTADKVTQFSAGVGSQEELTFPLIRKESASDEKGTIKAVNNPFPPVKIETTLEKNELVEGENSVEQNFLESTISRKDKTFLPVKNKSISDKKESVAKKSADSEAEYDKDFTLSPVKYECFADKKDENNDSVLHKNLIFLSGSNKTVSDKQEDIDSNDSNETMYLLSKIDEALNKSDELEESECLRKSYEDEESKNIEKSKKKLGEKSIFEQSEAPKISSTSEKIRINEDIESFTFETEAKFTKGVMENSTTLSLVNHAKLENSEGLETCGTSEKTTITEHIEATTFETEAKSIKSIMNNMTILTFANNTSSHGEVQPVKEVNSCQNEMIEDIESKVETLIVKSSAVAESFVKEGKIYNEDDIIDDIFTDKTTYQTELKTEPKVVYSMTISQTPVFNRTCSSIFTTNTATKTSKRAKPTNETDQFLDEKAVVFEGNAEKKADSCRKERYSLNLKTTSRRSTLRISTSGNYLKTQNSTRPTRRASCSSLSSSLRRSKRRFSSFVETSNKSILLDETVGDMGVIIEDHKSQKASAGDFDIFEVQKDILVPETSLAEVSVIEESICEEVNEKDSKHCTYVGTAANCEQSILVGGENICKSIDDTRTFVSIPVKILSNKITLDENYGNEMPSTSKAAKSQEYLTPSKRTNTLEECDMRLLLKTPKSSSTPLLKLNELFETPKVSGVKELIDSPKKSSPKNDLDLFQVEEEGFDKFFKTPRAKNIIIPNEPTSAVLNFKTDGVEHIQPTEYELNNTDTSTHLSKLYKIPVGNCIVQRLDEVELCMDESNEVTIITIANKKTEQFIENTTDSTPKQCSSHEEALSELTGSLNKLETPTKYYENGSTTFDQPPPFTACDVISEVHKADILQWVGNLKNTLSESNNNEGKAIANNEDGSLLTSTETQIRDPLMISIIEKQSSYDKAPKPNQKICLKINEHDQTKSSEKMIDVSMTPVLDGPLTSTMLKTTVLTEPSSLCKSFLSKEIVSNPSSPLESEMSGIQLLDQTVESIMEPLIVSSSEYLNETVEENNSIGSQKIEDKIVKFLSNDESNNISELQKVSEPSINNISNLSGNPEMDSCCNELRNEESCKIRSMTKLKLDGHSILKTIAKEHSGELSEETDNSIYECSVLDSIKVIDRALPQIVSKKDYVKISEAANLNIMSDIISVETENEREMIIDHKVESNQSTENKIVISNNLKIKTAIENMEVEHISTEINSEERVIDFNQVASSATENPTGKHLRDFTAKKSTKLNVEVEDIIENHHSGKYKHRHENEAISKLPNNSDIIERKPEEITDIINQITINQDELPVILLEMERAKNNIANQTEKAVSSNQINFAVSKNMLDHEFESNVRETNAFQLEIENLISSKFDDANIDKIKLSNEHKLTANNPENTKEICYTKSLLKPKAPADIPNQTTSINKHTPNFKIDVSIENMRNKDNDINGSQINVSLTENGNVSSIDSNLATSMSKQKFRNKVTGPSVPQDNSEGENVLLVDLIETASKNNKHFGETDSEFRAPQNFEVENMSSLNSDQVTFIGIEKVESKLQQVNILTTEDKILLSVDSDQTSLISKENIGNRDDVPRANISNSEDEYVSLDDPNQSTSKVTQNNETNVQQIDALNSEIKDVSVDSNQTTLTSTEDVDANMPQVDILNPEGKNILSVDLKQITFTDTENIESSLSKANILHKSSVGSNQETSIGIENIETSVSHSHAVNSKNKILSSIGLNHDIESIAAQSDILNSKVENVPADSNNATSFSIKKIGNHDIESSVQKSNTLNSEDKTVTSIDSNQAVSISPKNIVNPDIEPSVSQANILNSKVENMSIGSTETTSIDRENVETSISQNEALNCEIENMSSSDSNQATSICTENIENHDRESSIQNSNILNSGEKNVTSIDSNQAISISTTNIGNQYIEPSVPQANILNSEVKNMSIGSNETTSIDRETSILQNEALNCEIENMSSVDSNQANSFCTEKTGIHGIEPSMQKSNILNSEEKNVTSIDSNQAISISTTNIGNQDIEPSVSQANILNSEVENMSISSNETTSIDRENVETSISQNEALNCEIENVSSVDSNQANSFCTEKIGNHDTESSVQKSNILNSEDKNVTSIDSNQDISISTTNIGNQDIESSVPQANILNSEVKNMSIGSNETTSIDRETSILQNEALNCEIENMSSVDSNQANSFCTEKTGIHGIEPSMQKSNILNSEEKNVTSIDSNQAISISTTNIGNQDIEPSVSQVNILNSEVENMSVSSNQATSIGTENVETSISQNEALNCEIENMSSVDSNQANSFCIENIGIHGIEPSMQKSNILNSEDKNVTSIDSNQAISISTTNIGNQDIEPNVQQANILNSEFENMSISSNETTSIDRENVETSISQNEALNCEIENMSSVDSNQANSFCIEKIGNHDTESSVQTSNILNSEDEDVTTFDSNQAISISPKKIVNQNIEPSVSQVNILNSEVENMSNSSNQATSIGRENVETSIQQSEALNSEIENVSSADSDHATSFHTEKIGNHDVEYSVQKSNILNSEDKNMTWFDSNQAVSISTKNIVNPDIKPSVPQATILNPEIENISISSNQATSIGENVKTSIPQNETLNCEIENVSSVDSNQVNSVNTKNIGTQDVGSNVPRTIVLNPENNNVPSFDLDQATLIGTKKIETSIPYSDALNSEIGNVSSVGLTSFGRKNIENDDTESSVPQSDILYPESKNLSSVDSNQATSIDIENIENQDIEDSIPKSSILNSVLSINPNESISASTESIEPSVPQNSLLNSEVESVSSVDSNQMTLIIANNITNKDIQSNVEVNSLKFESVISNDAEDGQHEVKTVEMVKQVSIQVIADNGFCRTQKASASFEEDIALVDSDMHKNISENLHIKQKSSSIEHVIETLKSNNMGKTYKKCVRKNRKCTAVVETMTVPKSDKDKKLCSLEDEKTNIGVVTLKRASDTIEKVPERPTRRTRKPPNKKTSGEIASEIEVRPLQKRLRKVGCTFEGSEPNKKEQNAVEVKSVTIVKSESVTDTSAEAYLKQIKRGRRKSATGEPIQMTTKTVLQEPPTKRRRHRSTTVELSPNRNSNEAELNTKPSTKINMLEVPTQKQLLKRMPPKPIVEISPTRQMTILETKEIFLESQEKLNVQISQKNITDEVQIQKFHAKRGKKPKVATYQELNVQPNIVKPRRIRYKVVKSDESIIQNQGVKRGRPKYLTESRQNIETDSKQTSPKRETRNIPRHNYDETSDDESSTKVVRNSTRVDGRPKSTMKLLQLPSKTKEGNKLGNEQVATPISIPAASAKEEHESQKREARNVPRRNYDETSDDEKAEVASTGRSQRIRKLTTKALQLKTDRISTSKYIVSNIVDREGSLQPRRTRGVRAKTNDVKSAMTIVEPEGCEPESVATINLEPDFKNIELITQSTTKLEIKPEVKVSANKVRTGRRKAEIKSVIEQDEVKPKQKLHRIRTIGCKFKAEPTEPDTEEPTIKKSPQAVSNTKRAYNKKQKEQHENEKSPTLKEMHGAHVVEKTPIAKSTRGRVRKAKSKLENKSDESTHSEALKIEIEKLDKEKPTIKLHGRRRKAIDMSVPVVAVNSTSHKSRENVQLVEGNKPMLDTVKKSSGKGRKIAPMTAISEDVQEAFTYIEKVNVDSRDNRKVCSRKVHFDTPNDESGTNDEHESTETKITPPKRVTRSRRK